MKIIPTMEVGMNTFADRIIEFNRSLDFIDKLSEGISVMNPFRENDYILSVSSAFYKKYYSDNKPRHLILGINPGRFGSGVTGVPFTDTKRLTGECGLEYSGKKTHEPSSVFVYEVIKAYGGLNKFYSDFYINAICPLGFTISNEDRKEKNYNYYDNKELTNIVMKFIIETIKKQIGFGIETDVCFCFGIDKNYKFLLEINGRYNFFTRIIALEHPRFVMQYKSKFKQEYINKYINAFNQIK
jgi:Domain of unknown function (DUF4918)